MTRPGGPAGDPPSEGHPQLTWQLPKGGHTALHAEMTPSPPSLHSLDPTHQPLQPQTATPEFLAPDTTA